jgi:hypothetical protein
MNTLVETARAWSNELLRQEARGPGDLPNAMRRLETRYGLPARTFWSLRYRPPADILAGVFVKLQAAYQAECQRQLRKLTHEIETAKLLGITVDDIEIEASRLAQEPVNDE